MSKNNLVRSPKTSRDLDDLMPARELEAAAKEDLPLVLVSDTDT